MCNFLFHPDTTPNVPYEEIYNLTTDQECAHAVKRAYPNATGASWFEKPTGKECQSRYGIELGDGFSSFQSTCIFTDPCLEHSDCHGKHEICRSNFCYDYSEEIKWIIIGGSFFGIIVGIYVVWFVYSVVKFLIA